jgi:hypothetical protein
MRVPALLSMVQLVQQVELPEPMRVQVLLHCQMLKIEGLLLRGR